MAVLQPASPATSTDDFFELTPQRVVAAGEWTQERVTHALDAMLNGDFDQATRLSRAMMTDPTVRGCVHKRASALVRTPMSFEGSDIDAIEWLENAYPSILPENEFVQLLTWYLMLDVAMGQLRLQLVDGQYILKLHVLDPHSLRHNAPGFDGWSWYDMNRGRIPLVPGENGVVVLSRFNGTLAGGVVGGCGHTWQRKRASERYLLDYLDNAGWPITHAGGVPQEHRAVVARDLAHARVTKTIVTPKDYTIDVLSSGPDAKPEAHQTYIDYADRKLTVDILGANLSSDMSEGGSYSAAQVHEGVERRVVQADAADVSTQLRTQVFQPNVEVSGIATFAPYPRFMVEAPADTNAKLDVTLKAFEVLDRARAAGYDIQNFNDVLDGATPELQRIETNE